MILKKLHALPFRSTIIFDNLAATQKNVNLQICVSTCFHEIKSACLAIHLLSEKFCGCFYLDMFVKTKCDDTMSWKDKGSLFFPHHITSDSTYL